MQLRSAQETEKRVRAERVAAQEAEEEEFRRRMMAKFAEDERVEQLSAQRRRMKVLEHKRATERMIEERRVAREQEQAEHVKETIAETQRRDAFQAAIEEERQRLLREYATQLVDHLPPGTLRETDVDLLGLRDHFTARAAPENPYEDDTHDYTKRRK